MTKSKSSAKDGSPARDIAYVTVLTDGGGFIEVYYGPDHFGAVPEQGARLDIAIEVRVSRQTSQAGNVYWDLFAPYVGPASQEPASAAPQLHSVSDPFATEYAPA